MKVKDNIISKPHKNCPYCDKGEYPYTIPDDKLKCSHCGCIFLYPCGLYNKRPNNSKMTSKK